MSGKGLVGSIVTMVVLLLSLAAGVSAQSDVAALRDQARARFDVVTLTGGVGLVPKQSVPGVRLIEVREGAVSINGEPVSAKDVKAKLGKDADLVLRVTYLDAAGVATLTAAPGAPAIVPAQPTPPVPPTAPPAAIGDRESRREGRREREGRDKNDIVRFGGNVTVEKDERVAGEVVVMGGSASVLGTVDGELVVIGGTAEVEGTVEGDVIVVGGTLRLGPQSVVQGNVSVAGGTLHRESGSRVDGKVSEVGVGKGKTTITIGPSDGHRMGRWSLFGPMRSVGGLFGLLTRAVLLLLMVLVTVALGGRYVRPIAARAASEPLRSGGLGLLAEVLFVPVLVITVIVLAVSIVGIPFLLLLPFAMVLLLVVALMGFTGVVVRLGDLVSDRVGLASDSPYARAAVGVLAVMAIPLLGRALSVVFGGFLSGSVAFVGFLIEYVAWTVGFGAALWVLRRSRGRIPEDETPMSAPPSEMGPELMA